MGNNNSKVNEPESKAGERAAKYISDYLAVHGGLDLHQLAWRMKADKRDLQRLKRDESIGLRLLEKMFAYFGDDCRDAVFPPRDGRSIREEELAREVAEIEARHAKLERERAERRMAKAQTADRMERDKARPRPF